MTTLEQIQDTTARSAIGEALQAARASYEEITAARDELNALEASNVYSDFHIAEQRSQRADAVRQVVEGRITGARESVAVAFEDISGRLSKLTAVDPERLSTVQGQITMFTGDLREDPAQLFVVYEQSFDIPEDRRAIEDLAERALRVLPDTPARGDFERRWNALRKRLENRLPEKERTLRAALTELEQTREYLGAVAQATTASIDGFTNPRQRGNLTAYSKAHTYESELAGESSIQSRLPAASAAS